MSFERVSNLYNGVAALDDVSFDVREGELVTLLGPSGSGKSTLLGILAGITPLDRGRVLFKGRDVTGVPPHERNIGMVFQRYALFPNKTVAENIAFPLELRKLPADTIREKVSRMLEMVDLTRQAHHFPSEISGGQAQRVAVARALVFDPSLMLLDEPLGALDKALRENLQEEIRRIQKMTGVPTLYVTHDQDEAMNLSDRMVVMRSGRIAASGRPRDIYEEPPSLWVAKFLGDVNVLPLAGFPSGSRETAEQPVSLACP